MLEVCPSIAEGKIGIRVNLLSMGIEVVYIDQDTTVRGLKRELKWNEAAFR